VDFLRIRLETLRYRLDAVKAQAETAESLGVLEDVLEHPLFTSPAISRAMDNSPQGVSRESAIESSPGPGR
jgi:hypothetical protein